MPTPSTRTPVRIARGSYSNLNGSVSDLQDGEISYAEDQDKLYIKEGTSLVALTYTPASPAFTGTITGVNLTLSGNLTVNGTTTTINTQTLDVEDKNIVIGKVSTPTDTTADGGGITLKGASDKTFNWVDATDAWTSSEHIQLSTGKNLTLVSGALGIGDTTPNYEIHVVGADGAPQLRLESSAGTGNKRVDILLENGKAIFGANQSAQSIAFQTGYTDRLTIANDGSVTAAGTISDSKGDLRSIPQNAQTGSSIYEFVAADAGKHILRSGGHVRLPSNLFAAGTAITVINNSSSDINFIAGSGVTLYNTADGNAGQRILAAKGMATVIYTTAGANQDVYISGAGLS